MVKAKLAHSCADRLRLRFPSRRGDSAFFEKLHQAFAGVEGVHRVTIRPRTTSVIVEHDPSMEIVPLLQQVLGFTLEVPPPLLPLAKEAKRRLAALDKGLRTRTRGQLDLGSALFLGFAAVSVVQMLRGRWAPTALANAWAAVNLARRGEFEMEELDFPGNGDGNGDGDGDGE